MPDHRKHNLKLYILQCKAYSKLERGREAIKACDQALDIEPDHFDTRLLVRFDVLPMVWIRS